MKQEYEIVRIAAVSPETHVGNPDANAKEHLRILSALEFENVDIALFPELSLSGYTCGDLFGQQILLESCESALFKMVNHESFPKQMLIVIGMPIRFNNNLYNCAVVINKRKILGVIPKMFIPNYKEFYEQRWFASGDFGPSKPLPALNNAPFGPNQLFFCQNIKVGIEICEDLWVPISPSSLQSIAGANVLLNLSASNETIGKARYRKQLVASQSGKCVAAYVYASAGPTESTTDLVFGGHCLIAENGDIVAESERVGDDNMFGRPETPYIISDIDIEQIMHDRQTTNSYGNFSVHNLEFKETSFGLNLHHQDDELYRKIDGMPFVPKNKTEKKHRCAEIFGIQCNALAQRIFMLGDEPKVYIGVSGGLDSTLALMTAVQTFDMFDLPRENINGLTMPGFGTTEKTKNNAQALMDNLGISSETIDIRLACLQAFRDIKHKPFGIELQSDTHVENFCKKLSELSPETKAKGDLDFENVQARMRTMILMSKGFVLGTGDLSEAYLGWCTYNGDHMSMYNVNCSVPKTLVKSIVEHVADSRLFSKKTSKILKKIAATEISPELLPPNKDGEIEQSTEDTLGPYILHDFFMYNFIRFGFSPKKMLFLLEHADFGDIPLGYSDELIKKTLKTNLTRFFRNQFKRSCVPDGPKVGTVSLSPRGDWRMPSDADPSIWLKELE